MAWFYKVEFLKLGFFWYLCEIKVFKVKFTKILTIKKNKVIKF